MKKIMMLMAAAAIVMACGGNSEKKDEAKTSDDAKKTEQTSDETKKTESVVDQNKAWMEKIANAKDEAEAEKLIKEYEEWVKSLSDEDMKALEEAAKAEFEREVYESCSDSTFDYDSKDGYYDDDEDHEAVDVRAITKKAQKFCDRMKKAMQDEDYEAMERIDEEFNNWFESLSYAEIEVASEAMEKLMEDLAVELEE